MFALTGYSIHELIHQSGRFAIYKANRNSDQQKVILKVCRSDQSNLTDLVTLQHEYQILKQLDLSGIVHVYDLIKLQDKLVLVLEDIDGLPLEQYLAKGPLDLSTFFKIAIQIVDAIGELHLQQIIHKDINPNNIIINGKTFTVKLADFSVSSELIQESHEHHSLIDLEGTLPYISPEQTGRMNRAVDYRSDFYSLGITFYEMLTGRLPFKSEDALELVHFHLTLMPAPVTTINPAIPPVIGDIVTKLLSKIPEGRYASAAGLKSDLVRCQQEWEATKQIKSFPLGQKEIQDHLIISQKLYGREEQVDKLLEKFDRVSQGQTELMLVSGYSGIGKTSLVKEIYRPIIRQRGYFLSGKYDQLQRATPYSAIIEAFSEFGRHCLGESEAQLSILRKSLLVALGNNGQIIINLIPNLELIIGPQPPVPELGPGEAQNRLRSTFQDFVRVLAQPDHPLVLFLDDLQWIDNASLQLLNLLLTDSELHYFLMIGAYRDNEVTPDHPLILMQKQLEKMGVSFSNLVLSPLKQEDIQHLIEDSLLSVHEKIPTFAELILGKTQGNPFFIIEFLKKLYHDKLLIYSYQDRCWKWDIKKIQELSITDNVIDLLISRIDRLPQKTQKLLELAACIGHTFDLLTLSTINEQDLSETAKYVLEATKASFIIPINENYRLLESIAAGTISYSRLSNDVRYRFIHDKIQQAAYQMIPEETKQQVHLQIGRLLLKEKKLNEKDEQLFEILNHFNYSLIYITDTQEKLKLTEYNLWAGKKAKVSSAYQAAKDYLEAGLQLIEPIDPNIKYDLQFALLKELAICQYLTGEFEQAEASFNQLLKSAKETLSTIEIYKLNCEMLSTLNRHDEAIHLGLKVLATVNISIPENPKLLHILWSILKIKMQIGRRRIPAIQFPMMESKKYRAIAELISQLYNSAFVTNQNLFVLLVCTNVHLSLRYGYTDSTGFSCIVYAFIVMHCLNWYKEGLDFYELYKNLSKQYSQANFEGKNEFIIGSFIDPWRLELDKSLDVLNKSYQYLYDAGDIVYSNYCNLLMTFHSFAIGKPLAETNVYLQNSIHFIKKVKAKDFNKLNEALDFFLKSLTINEFSITQLSQYEKEILECKNNTEISFFYMVATKLCYLFGYFEEAKTYGQQQENYAQYSLGLVMFLEGCFYHALTIFSTFSTSNKKYSLRKLRKIHSYLKRWATWCPFNYQSYLYLFDAEMARIQHDIPLAIQCYTKAITAAEQQNLLNIQALANECFANFYKEFSASDVTELYYKHAHTAYRLLGALTKVKALENAYPKLAAPSDLSPSYSQDITGAAPEAPLTSIDMLSLMRSAQAISGEIQLDKLLQKLLIILLQNAGAHRVILLSRENDTWYVEAEGTASEQRISLAHVEKMEQRNDLPFSLIRYVQRSEKPILIQTSEDIESYAINDEYISLAQPQSILVIPVFFHGELQSILYLENRTVTMAFKNEHVHILQILSSQAAISLQNARLYYQATHDSLTGLSNRNLLYQLFNLFINKSDRTHTSIAILLFDLDFFKMFNDTLGHYIGDKILLHFADLLTMCLRKENLAVRLGGDEFVAMIEFMDIKEVSDIAEKFIGKLKDPFYIDGHEINLTASIGISLYPDDGNDIAELLKQADIALYRVKSSGKNYFKFYTTSLDHQIKQEYRQEIELRHALEKRELCVYYQPVFSAIEHQPTHFEALMRWQHPQHGLIAAKYFIATAEKTGLIVPLGRWVLRAALEQIKTWQSAGIKPIPIAVNISGLQFKVQTINELVAEILEDTHVDASYLQLEFTESVSIEYTEKVLDDIAKLKALGVKLTLDDFGTYYSSLSYLRQGVVDKLKIDKTFVNGIDTGRRSDKELITAIINLAHSLNLKVVAEGVETQAQMHFLEIHYIDELQGYYLGHPMSADDCSELLLAKVKTDETNKMNV